MRLTLLGTGLPAPNPRRRGPAQVIRTGTENILIDCGSGATQQLVQAGIRPIEVDHLLITHDHSDHNVDLGHFIISRWIYGDDRPLHIYGTHRLPKMVEILLELHAYDFEVRNAHRRQPRALPHVISHVIEPGDILETPSACITAFLVEHAPVEPSYGFRIQSPTWSIVISGDTRPCENVIRHAHRTDVLVHECTDAAKMPYAPGSGWESQEQKIKALSEYHTLPHQVGAIAREAQVGRLITTHMVAATVPAELHEVIARDFKGPVVTGEDLMEC